MAKVIHVHLIGRRKDYYFSSVKAVFKHLTKDDIGVTENWLAHCGLSQGAVIANSKAIIKQGCLIGAGKEA